MRMKTLFLVSALALTGGCLGLEWGGSRTGVVTEQVEFRGWPHAWKISNRACEMVVVPAINHVMSFSLKGGANLLWVAPEANGAMVQEAGVKWHNFGGDKVWPAYEELWRPYMKRRWPPSYAFDGGVATVEPVAGGLRMTSPEDPDFGAVCVREFLMDERKPLVVIRQHFEKRSGRELSFMVWSVTQVREASCNLLPLAGRESGLRYQSLGALTNEAFAVDDSCLAIRNHAMLAQKVGVGRDAASGNGWVAACYGAEGALFVQSHDLDPQGVYPDKGCQAEIFTSNREFGMYTELELLGPQVLLRPGERLRHDIVWQIVPVKETPGSIPAEISGIAARAHRAAIRILRQLPPVPGG